MPKDTRNTPTKQRVIFDERLDLLSNFQRELATMVAEIADVLANSDAIYDGTFDSPNILHTCMKARNSHVYDELHAVARTINTTNRNAIERLQSAKIKKQMDTVTRQVFKPGCIVSVNVALRDDVAYSSARVDAQRTFGRLYERLASRIYSVDDFRVFRSNTSLQLTRETIGKYCECNVDDILDIDTSSRKFTRRVQVEFNPIRHPGPGYVMQTLADDALATVVDTSTSKTYVEIVFDEPVRKAWMKRAELTIVGS